jgi:hypothetical protein
MLAIMTSSHSSNLTGKTLAITAKKDILNNNKVINILYDAIFFNVHINNISIQIK